MRLAALLLTALLLASGCLEAADDPEEADAPEGDLDSDGVPDTTDDSDGDGTVDAEDPTPVAVPADIVFEGSLKGVGDVSANAPVECPLDAQQCAEHTVTVPAGDWTVTFTLVGTNGMVTSNGVPYETDYDLFVEGVGESINPSGEPDVVTGRLAARDYTATVLAWHDIDGSYTLTVSFAP